MIASRRKFIKQTIGTGASVLLAHSARSLGFTPRRKKVLVIGAGFSGLAAAFSLKQKGWDVTVLESRSRIGGRVFSHAITDELVIELGGEWVGDSHHRLRTLCDQFKLPLQNNQLDTHLLYKEKYTPSREWQYSEKWQLKLERVLDSYSGLSETEKIRLDKMDWWRYLVQNGCNDRDLDIRELFDSTDFGESLRHVSAFAALSEYAESSPKNEMDLKIKGGNASLAIHLAEMIGLEKILVAHHVERIEQNEGVNVSCTNGAVFRADKLICTTPTFALSKIDWQPALPTEMMSAINALQYARINKHAMLFKERFWREENFDMITDQLPQYFYHATKNQVSGAGVLIAYTIGDKAAVMAGQNEQRNRAAILEAMRPGFGNVGNLVEKQVNYYWGNDPYSKGAYALYGKGQWFELRPILQKSFLHTHFAGEHLADWQGFMEGAINSGEDAAAQI